MQKSIEYSPEFTNFLKKNVDMDTSLKKTMQKVDDKKREATVAYLRACYSRLYQKNC